MNLYSVGFYTLVFFTILCTSCKTDPLEGIPAYLKIDTITFTINDPEQGAASNKITDAWVYVDDILIGTYELPVTFPVLANGKRQVRVRPGIIINGIAATRTIYPFYNDNTFSVDFKPKVISEISPAVQYHSSFTFAWKADFETEIKIERRPGSHTDVVRFTDPSVFGEYNGTACGAVFLDADSFRFAGSSLIDFPFDLPRTTQPVFLEMDYMSNNKFSVGIMARNPVGDQGHAVLHINPNKNWNKIYVNLTEAVNQHFQADGYYFFILAEKSEDVQEAAIYIDNLKILY